MPLYITPDMVQVRLAGKVRFDENGEDPNMMPLTLALELMDQAEGDVELDLSPRFATPFQTSAGAPYGQLVERPTKRIIRTLCLNAAICYILGTDFGKGSAVNGDEYVKILRRQSKSIVDRLMMREEDGGESLYRQWKYPPLPGLRLAAGNAASDDGFAGQIYITGSNEGGFAAHQADAPEVSFWTGADCDGGEGFINPNWRP